MKSLYYNILTLLSLLLFVQHTYAQTSYRIDEQRSSIIISGTSTLHDWDMECKEIDGEATLFNIDQTTAHINKGHLIIAVENIKSHSKMMDSQAYKSMNLKKYPTIKFTLAEYSPENTTIKGHLTLTNQTKEITLKDFDIHILQETIHIKGHYMLLMSDFGITPPTVMMGSLKTGDLVRISFDLFLVK